MADLNKATELVAAAVADAGITGDDAPNTPTESTEVTPGEGVVSPSSSAAAVEPATEPVAEPEPVDDVEAELAAQGIKPPIEGQRENRIPYARVQKIVANARKKLVEQHEAAIRAEQAKYQPVEQKARQLDALSRLITDNPDAALAIFAKQSPGVQRYIDALRNGTVAPPKGPEIPPGDPEPMPDAKFPDGSEGYTPEQHKKLLAWHERRATDAALKAFNAAHEKQFGPIVKSFQAQEQMRQIAPRIKEMEEQAKAVWGDLYDKHRGDNGPILKYMKENPNVPFSQAVATVLVPLLREDQNAMKSRVLKEINARPAAAQRSAPAPSKVEAPTGPMSTEDIVAQAVRSAGLIR
jgi:hypothetical protein